jgi:hypothetical protein
MAYTAEARKAFIQKFYDETPSDLEPAERLRRAMAARRAFYVRIALKSAAARRKKARKDGDQR